MNIVSSNELIAGLTVAIITILLLPLNGSCNSLVNFESLQGIYPLFCEVNAVMHLPKANKLLLIEPLSAFFFPKIGARSLPAKSTNTNLPKVFSIVKLILSLFCCCSTSKYICNIA